jgi:hypothetical protein
VTGSVPLRLSRRFDDPFSYAERVSCCALAQGIICKTVLRVGLRTVDVGAHREGRVVREGFSRVVICAIDVDVVLLHISQ